MNEKGLVANTLYLVESDYGTPDGTRPTLSIAAWAQYALDNYATVNDAVSALRKEPFTVVAPVLGPILGGSICDNISWPFIFFINVPIALGCAPLIARMLGRFETAKLKAPIDIVGLVLLVIFVGALQLMLDMGKEHDWFAAVEIRALAAIAGRPLS